MFMTPVSEKLQRKDDHNPTCFHRKQHRGDEPPASRRQRYKRTSVMRSRTISVEDVTMALSPLAVALVTTQEFVIGDHAPRSYSQSELFSGPIENRPIHPHEA